MRNGTAHDAGIVVIGGGLAGLAAATFAGRAGRPVTVLERSSHLGGRAITNRYGEFSFNLGPHALYRGGPGKKVLDELNVPFHGGAAPLTGHASLAGELHKLSPSPQWFMSTPLLRGGAKLESARMLAKLPFIDTEKLGGISLRAWLERETQREDTRRLIATLVRVATYANAPGLLSAQVALRQMQLALRGVLYLDGGWQTLVDGLRRAAEEAGARIVTGARAASIERDGSVRGVRLDGGEVLPASTVIIASTPDTAADLTGVGAYRDVTPVRAACLDVGLSKLPVPKQRFALGMDSPLYLSVHSGVARLGPDGAAMIHVAKYLAPDEQTDARALERELEEHLDLAQPGWRAALVELRFLPDMTVVAALATAARGGLAGRPAPEVPGAHDVLLAGDWVGPEGWLSDASLASAKAAAELALRLPTREASRASTVGDAVAAR